MNLKQKLQDNKAKGKATLATNFYNFETLLAVLSAAKNNNTSLILQVSESSVQYLGIKIIKSMASTAISEFGVEAWLHLDHGNDPNIVKACIDAGFDSVMIDASEKSFAENVAITSDIVKYASSCHINVEAELGYVAKLGQNQAMVYTKPSEAKAFVDATGIDALAVAVGSAHGFYKETPQLQFDLIQEIKDQTNAALVLHGSSGIPDIQLQKSILCGITKINLATEIKDIFMKKLKAVLTNTDEIDLRKVFPKATQAAIELVSKKMVAINA
jgi:ketose-bisphosphate aldolase